MKTKTLKIEVPKGYEIDSLDREASEITFKEKRLADVTDRIKTIFDALDELGDNDPEVITYNKIRTALDSHNHLVNYQIAVILIRAINEKREPNWNDSDELKYTNYFEMGGSSGFRFHDYDGWHSSSHVGSRLCFFTPRHGEYLAKQFPDVFKNFMPITK